jgi:hypothetical protein
MRDSVLALAKPHDIIAPQFYREGTETRQEFKTRVTAEAHRLRNYRLMPVISVYDRNGTLNDVQIIHTIIDMSELAEEMGWFGMMLFRMGTTDGLTATTHLAIRPYLERLVGGVEPAPKPTFVEEPVSMRTSVSHLVTNFRFGDFDLGIETRPANQVGGDETVEVVKNPDGTYSIKSADGDEWLSVQPDSSLQSRPTSDPSQPRSWEKFQQAR